MGDEVLTIKFRLDSSRAKPVDPAVVSYLGFAYIIIGVFVADVVRIECINKSDRYNPHERITHVGGRKEDDTQWKLTQAQAIASIESGRWKFFVTVDGHPVWVIVALSLYGHKYLKTENDGEQPNNLLSLPECPK